ncbi:MAG: glycosyltransferase [Myxococcales bacterium]|nr:glycosyltransferase [Myxococcales bacterium]
MSHKSGGRRGQPRKRRAGFDTAAAPPHAGGVTRARTDVVIPARDAERDLPTTLDRAFLRELRSLIVVDRGSTDGTAGVARDLGAVVLREAGGGYGAACLRALAHFAEQPRSRRRGVRAADRAPRRPAAAPPAGAHRQRRGRADHRRRAGRAAARPRGRPVDRRGLRPPLRPPRPDPRDPLPGAGGAGHERSRRRLGRRDAGARAAARGRHRRVVLHVGRSPTDRRRQGRVRGGRPIAVPHPAPRHRAMMETGESTCPRT